MFVRPLDLLALEWIKQSILDDSTPPRYLGPNLDRPSSHDTLFPTLYDGTSLKTA
ncbi:unnamed protein product [Ectocarpus sp. 12 AP-2014]